jgi:hypothetical protein
LVVVSAVLFAARVLTRTGEPPATDSGPTYYVSPAGNDNANGLSPRRAWRSVDRASRAVFRPGDRLLFEGGSEFAGRLVLEHSDGGRADQPVVVGSYGTGRARIMPRGEAGVSVINTAGVEIRDLEFVGDEAAHRTSAGISFFADEPAQLDHVVVANVDVSGFRDGINLGGKNGGGFRDVQISDSVLHDNSEVGLLTYGPPFDAERPTYAHQRVTISGVEVYHNVGDPTNPTRNTGSGILIGSVDGATVERSSAHDNGALCNAIEGPVGIWAYDSRRVVIQRNLSYNNRTSVADGGGFDFDQNVSESVLQYNLSYGNDGAGFLVYSAVANTALKDNVVRFNISAEDARRSSRYGGITVVGSAHNIDIYHNTVVISGEAERQPAALLLAPGLTGVTVRNNIFRVTTSGPVVAAPRLPTSDILLQGNDYINLGGPLAIWWGDTTYSTLRAWRSGTGQELDGADAVGISADPWPSTPQLAGLRNAADITMATAFMVPPTSPVVGKGMDLRARFGIDVGATDFWSHPLSGIPPTIGAHQVG